LIVSFVIVSYVVAVHHGFFIVGYWLLVIFVIVGYWLLVIFVIVGY